MIEILNYKVLMVPVPKGRPRVTRYGTYTPKRTLDAEIHIRRSLKHLEPLNLANEALFMHIKFHMPIAKSWSKKKKAENLGKQHTQRPDLDNLVKLVKDSLQGFITDDCIISKMEAEKVWSETGSIDIILQTNQ